MKTYFGYVRVSTVKQGDGVSLQEQKAAIEAYASRNSLTISAWYEEMETAAKRGRTAFTAMMQGLRRGVADGVIIHKIDRGARNLKDWADLGQLIDRGIEVHFTHESLDLGTRGGRLSADIQAVVAADYIRNLREETRKGFYGRLKQGLYPLGAPIGYEDNGKGRPKTPDPVMAPLVRHAFVQYAGGTNTLHLLRDTMETLGLRNRRGGVVSINGIATMLRNPFYMGVIRLKSTGETFRGVHEPIVTTALYEQVQRVLDGKMNAKVVKHDFLFRKLLRCAHCGYSLIGERQKDNHYYRCHTKGCPTTAVREEAVDQKVIETLETIRLSRKDVDELQELIGSRNDGWAKDHEKVRQSLQMQKKQTEARLDRLMDAFLDGDIDREAYMARREMLLKTQRKLEEEEQVAAQNTNLTGRLSDFLELLTGLYPGYISGIQEEKRRAVEILTSNRQLYGKNLEFTLYSPCQEIAESLNSAQCDPKRDRPRTLKKVLELIVEYIMGH